MTTHLSVRLTWHDSAWNSCICENPEKNVFCVLHQHIRESRDLESEIKNKGKPLSELSKDFPPCSRDTGAYGKQGYTIIHKDPLDHRNLPSCNEQLPPFTCCPSPYRWMREENLRSILESEMFELRPNDDNRKEGWVYEPDRQQKLLKQFWGKIEKGKSLVFYYLNNITPLSEQHSRILVGIGRVKNIGELMYFGKRPPKYTDDYPVWSRAVTQNYPEEGVRLPYQEYLNKNYDVEPILCPVPNSASAAFSFVGEHISDDIALSVVERFIQSVQRVKKDNYIHGDWDRQIKWLNDVLIELWKGRGPFPGIGSVLQYLDFPQGPAYHRFVLSKMDTNIWEYVKEILDGEREPEQNSYREGLLKARGKWQKLPNRHKLLALLTRLEITSNQVARIIDPNKRNDCRIFGSNEELIDNPYLICEQDIGTNESEVISLDCIDHAMRPEQYDASLSATDTFSQDDPRRVRAIAIDVLKQAASAGDTLLSFAELIKKIKEHFPEQRKCDPDIELIIADQEFYKEVLAGHFILEQGWCGLQEYHDYEIFITDTIKRRSKRTNKINWNDEQLHHALLHHPKIGQPSTDREKQAIAEKTHALNTLLTQRISVLTGGAGTGKTTLLNVFVDILEKIEGKQALLLLAPTGKARVKLASVTGRPTQTIHQLLLRQGWLDPERFIFHKESSKSPDSVTTVIIDESSMLSVDLLGTLLKAIDKDAIKRLILVGDPNQLPPIGPGRPFADIIQWLVENQPCCIAGLETCMRTMDGDSASISVGLELANSYRSNNDNPADDELLSLLAKGQAKGDVDIYFWNVTEDLMDKIQISLKNDLEINKGDYKAFSDSLGFTTDEWENAEKWQILSPTRRDQIGTDELNRLIQAQFKPGLLSNARNPWSKNRAKPFGDNEIVWSDKVIQLMNRKRNGWPRNLGIDYVANGEIGLVERTSKDYLQVIFSTQPQVSYRYYRGEVNGLLELAYALTIHKAQGSDFEIVYLILPQSASTLSRELIYTGLTRFRKKLILLVEKDIKPLLMLRKSDASDVMQRNTNMFNLLIRTDEKQKIYTDNLIHRARNGEVMRSKSEVIVADILIDLDLNPRYEEPLYAKGSTIDFRLPDFTINYEGDTYYWEHLGMLTLPSYKESWEHKKKWYKNNGYWDMVITSEDSPDGGIDATIIESNAINKILRV